MHLHSIHHFIQKDMDVQNILAETYLFSDKPFRPFPNLERHRTHLEKLISSWDFPALDLSMDELCVCAFLIFEESNVLDELHVNRDKLKNFVVGVEARYHPNPYHNFFHAVDVLQTTFFMIKTLGSSLSSYLRSIDVLGLLIAAFCHDIGHPGCNNLFLCNAKLSIATIFSQRSVLENYHLMIMFALLDMEAAAIFSNVKTCGTIGVWQEVKSLMVESILATDMALHFDILKNMEARFSTGEPLSVEKAADRGLVASLLLKCADICNICRNYKTHSRWVMCLLDEYNNQGIAESSLGLSQHPYSNSSCLSTSRIQLDFISTIAEPLFDLCTRIFEPLYFLACGLRVNQQIWKEEWERKRPRNKPHQTLK